MPEPSVSIVIPARDEADSIGGLLDDCAAQTRTPDEVIVVDAGSTDRTGELLRARAAAWGVLVVESSPGAMPGAARNHGIERARSQLIATLDAGTRIGPRWLESMVAELGDHTLRRVVVGTCEVDAHSRFEAAAGFIATRTSRPPSRPSALPYRPAGRNGYCFAKASWERAGGYPPQLPGGEDKIFIDRLRDLGCEVVVARHAVARWRPRGSLSELWEQYSNYGRGDALAGIDPQNELVTLALYLAAAWLAARGARTAATATLLAYYGGFAARASRSVSSGSLTWIPAVRATADIAKITGYLSVVAKGRRP